MPGGWRDHSSDFLFKAAAGGYSGFLDEGRFGHSDNIGTSYTPITRGGVYQMPTAAVSLEIVSSSASDALNSTGAHEYYIRGVDENWDAQVLTVTAHATDGTVAVAVPGSWFRVEEWGVTKSGNYNTLSSFSHAGTLTLRVASAGATWSSIPSTPVPWGRSEIACIAVPRFKQAWVHSGSITVSSTQDVSFALFVRPNADDVTGPTYDGALVMRRRLTTLNAGTSTPFAVRTPLGPYIGPADIVFAGVVSASTGEADMSFDFMLEDV